MGGQDGKLVVLSGPSGAGKTSVVRALKEEPGVVFSVSATTRGIRAGERDGVDYFFLSVEDFLARRDRGEFLEYADYNGRYYGTLRAPMEQALACGKTFVLEIEVDGTRQLRYQNVPGIYIFLVPPSLEALRARLTERGQNSAREIEERIAIARREMAAAEMYDHVIENHVLADTIAAVKRLIGIEVRAD